MPRFREWDLKCKVYVGNLGSSCSKNEIEGAFNKYGQLRNVWVARNPPVSLLGLDFIVERLIDRCCRYRVLPSSSLRIRATLKTQFVLWTERKLLVFNNSLTFHLSLLASFRRVCGTRIRVEMSSGRWVQFCLKLIHDLVNLSQLCCLIEVPGVTKGVEEENVQTEVTVVTEEAQDVKSVAAAAHVTGLNRNH